MRLPGREHGFAALVAAGVALGVFSGWAFSRTGVSGPAVARELLLGWALLAGGLVAWWRWPGNGLGRLVVAEGFAWFLPNLRGSGDPVLFAVGTVLAPFNDVLVIHLIVAFPSGHLEARWQRLTMLVAYAVALASGVAYALIDDPASDWSPFTCQRCTENAMLVFSNNQLFWWVTLVGAAAAGAIALATVAVVARTWAVSTAAARRASAARWWACALGAFVIATDGGRNFALPLAPAGWTALDWANELAQVGVVVALALGAIWTRAARAAVGELLVEFDRTVSPAGLSETVARTLGDPSVELAFWLPEIAGYVDARGRSVRLPGAETGRVITVQTGSGQPLAAIVHDPALASQPGLVAAVRSAIRLGLENERLRTELEAQLQEVRESRARIIEAADDARRQTEHDLHDGAQQRLLSLGLLLEGLQGRLLRHPDERALAAVDEARQQLRLGLEELRELARGIHPAILSQAGLPGALASLATRSPMAVTLAVRCGRCRPSVETTAYFVASEALCNVTKHARASAASIGVEQEDDGRLVMEIADDGAGGADPARGSGMRGMADRVAAFGGTLRLESPPGGGTRIRVELPCG